MADLQPEHIEFARALVALARQHKVGMLDVTFRTSASAIHSGPDFWSWKQMRMNWSEGRHGDTSRITLRHEAETQIDERAADGVLADAPELAEIKPPITANCRPCKSHEACRTAGCGRAQWIDGNWFRNQPAGAPGLKATERTAPPGVPGVDGRTFPAAPTDGGKAAP